MLTTLALCLVTSLPIPLQQIADPIGDILVDQMNGQPWPWGFNAPMYDPVRIEKGAVTSATGGYTEEAIYIQIPTFVRINVAAPEPLLNKHIRCNNLEQGTWKCTERTSWTGDFDPQAWKDFDIAMAGTAEEILNEI
jgi:hypothetical protein